MKNIKILRLRIFLLSVFVMLLCVITKAERFEVYPFSYEILSEEEKTVEISKDYDKDTEQNLIIPETVEYDGVEYKVVSIGYFTDINTLESVVIPNSIERIGFMAFWCCYKLKKLEIGSSVNYVDTWALCFTPAYITVDPENPYFTSEDGLLYNKDKTVLHKCQFAPDDGQVKVANTTVKILDQAFRGNRTIKFLYLPSSLEKLGTDVFEDCWSLSTIICLSPVPPGSLSLYDSFEEDVYPCTIYVPKESLDLYVNAWGYNFGVYPVEYYPVTSIQDNIGNFKYNMLSETEKVVELSEVVKSQEEIIIPSTITYSDEVYTVEMIGRLSFSGCSEVKTIKIPATVNCIGAGAFIGCFGLQSIILETPEPPILGPRAFLKYIDNYYNILSVMIFVPDESVERYKASSWGDYDIRPMSEYEEMNAVGFIFENVESEFPAKVYTLDGRFIGTINLSEELNQLEKGLYIINGKKILIQ